MNLEAQRDVIVPEQQTNNGCCSWVLDGFKSSCSCILDMFFEIVIWIYYHFCRFCRCFTITGQKRVERKQLKEEDFWLPEEEKLANYDQKLVARYWNNTNLSQSSWFSLAQSMFFCRGESQDCLCLCWGTADCCHCFSFHPFHWFFGGIFLRLLPISLVYTGVYYLVQRKIFAPLFCETTYNLTQSTTTPHAPSENKTNCSKELIDVWVGLEKDFTTVLTLFIGFFVSFSINNWSAQIKLIPRLDQVVISLETFLWVDPRMKTDVKLKGNLTTKDVRRTIVRYYLLSWAMCLSRISRRLYRTLPKANAFNRKKLLHSAEAKKLNVFRRNGYEHENWREKWTTPLVWINKMAYDIRQKDPAKCFFGTYAGIGDVKDGITKPCLTFLQELQKLDSHNLYRIPHSLINVLTTAVYLFMIISVFAAQDGYKDQMPSDLSESWKNLFDFPLFAMIKYLLLFGWMKFATDLSNPMGTGR